MLSLYTTIDLDALAAPLILNPAARRDLPSPPLDDDLEEFVNTIRSPQYQYNIYRAIHIVDEFLLRLRGISTRIVDCIDLDCYFRAVYRYLLEKPENERVCDRIFRSFWEDYSLTSRQMALDHICEDLRRAEDEHRLAHDKYRTALLSCGHRGFTTQDDEYQETFDALEETLQTVRECVRRCNLAAKQCKSQHYLLRNPPHFCFSVDCQVLGSIPRSGRREMPAAGLNRLVPSWYVTPSPVVPL